MSLFAILLILCSFLNVNWFTDTEKLIDSIDEKSILKTTKIRNNVVVKFFKYGEFKKTEFYLSKDSFCDSAMVELYASKKGAFARKIISKGPFLRKNGKLSTDPDGAIDETIQIFKSEKEGIELNRSIEYYSTSNLDSLFIQLNKISFDTTKIGNEEYIITQQIYKKWKK